MRLTVTTFLSLDGVMQGPGGAQEDPSGGFTQGGWLPPHFDATVGGFMDEVFAQADAFLLGRRTYDIFAAYWPKVAEEEGGRVAVELNGLPKHVATTRDDALTWSGAQRLDGGDLAAAVGLLKAQPGRELQVHGSGALVGSLMRAGLVDTFRLLVFPVVLGQGRRLFADGVPPTGLRLAQTRTSESGVMMSTYDYTGAPVYGSVEG